MEDNKENLYVLSYAFWRGRMRGEPKGATQGAIRSGH